MPESTPSTNAQNYSSDDDAGQANSQDAFRFKSLHAQTNLTEVLYNKLRNTNLLKLPDYKGDKILNLGVNSILNVNKTKIDTLFDGY